MYAVIKTGGKQYRVEKDAVLQLEKLPGEAGDSLTFDQVLLLGDGESTKVGSPTLEGAQVTAEVLEQTRGPKIVVFKKKRRKNYRRKNGHRQDLTVVRITDIQAEAAKKKRASRAKAKPQAESKAEPKPEPAAEAPAENAGTGAEE